MPKENIEKTAIFPIGMETKQVKETKHTWGKGVVDVEDDFTALIVAYENSFAIGGIVEKVASKADSGFAYFEVDDKNTSKESESLYKFLQSIDLPVLFTELFVSGNSFFEIVRNTDDTEVLAEHFLLETIRVTTEKPEDEEEDAPHSYLQKSGTDEAKFKYKDVLHFKTPNMKTKYYGKSKFYKCVDQVTLLGKIDKFYYNLLAKGNIKTKLLIDKTGKLNDPQKEAIKNIITDAISGVDKGFNTAIIPAEMDTLDLQDDSETNAFLEYRRELIKSICVGCTFPYDLLISDSSNRSTSEVAMETLNEDLVVPFQKLVLRQLKEHIKLLDIRPEELVDMISFNSVDVSNEKEKMEVITGYKKAGIIDANEARELSPYNLDERPDGNTLSVQKDGPVVDPKVEDITKTIGKRYTPAFISKSKECAKNVKS